VTTAERLLAWARAVAAHPELGLQGTWPRAAALLGRQALEEGLDGFWMRQLPEMREATRATQLACFERFVRTGTSFSAYAPPGRRSSRACHHHPYALAPTAHELEHWFSSVDELLVRLSEEV